MAQTSLSFLEGSTPSDLRLVVVDEARPASPSRIALSQLSVVGVEITNRTSHLALRADRPRLLTQHGVPRVELPGNGRLLRYALRGGARWGFVWIRPDGAPTVLLELAGVGAGLVQDPFADRFGVAPDGRHVAMITAAGELHLARLDGSVYASSGVPARRVQAAAPVERISVCVGPTHVFFQTTDARVWRCPFTEDGVPVDLTPATSQGIPLQPEMAPSGDGTAAVFVHGPPNLELLYLVKSQGPAVALAVSPAHYESAGYLPAAQGGPRLLLDEDGSRLLYTSRTISPEIYLLDTTGATATNHITADANFEPYIGTGIRPEFVGDTVVLAVGDPRFGFDWISADTGSTGVVNITATTLIGPPYWPGTLWPYDAGRVASGVVLVDEIDLVAGRRLRRVDAAIGRSALVATRLRAAPQLCRASGAPNLLFQSLGGDQLMSAALSPLVVGPVGVWIAPGSDLAGGSSVFVAALPTGPSAAILLLPGGGLLPLPPDPVLQQAAVTPAGALVLSGSRLWYARPGLSTAVPTMGSIRVVLSHRD